MQPETLKHQLCKTFCASINVRPVPSGLAVSSAFSDHSGDPISFYVTVLDAGEFRIEDDGSYLSHLIAKDIPIDQGPRGQLLDAILKQANSYWDRDTLEIRSSAFPEDELSHRAIDFMSSLLRVRDLELFTRDVVRSTFRADATAAIEERYCDVATFRENTPVKREFAEFPADLVISPTDATAFTGALYFVSSNDKLNEALLLQLEALRIGSPNFRVIALLEEPEMKAISSKKFQRAQNRSVIMPIFRGDEEASVLSIGRTLKLVA
ncbi:MAG: DUF1828 domain-containing protein [Bryobacteraceae bacterium]|nr:DUF1828 domain-containing protein [Bryobacteraceae bacterium]